MKINSLLKNTSYIDKNFNENFDIENLCIDSRKECENAIFFAVKGSKKDGNKYIRQALKNGAIVVVTNKTPKVKCNYVLCSDVNLLKAEICFNFYNFRSLSLTLSLMNSTASLLYVK